MADLNQVKKDAKFILEEELEQARFDLDDLLVDADELDDKIRQKELEISDLEDRLEELDSNDSGSN